METDKKYLKALRITMKSKSSLKRNVYISIVSSVFSLFVGIVVNLLLVGFLVRTGGFDVLGIWVLVNAAIILLKTFEFGLSRALTREVVIGGVHSAASYIVLLLKYSFVLMAVLLTIYFILDTYDVSEKYWLLLVGAALLQINSDWLISMRLGLHEQYWFQLKLTLRVVVQTLLVVLYFQDSNFDSNTMFSLVIFFGSVSEYIFVIMVLIFHKSHLILLSVRNRKKTYINYKELLSGFAMLNILELIYDPFRRILISQFAGTVALGEFTVAHRPGVLLQTSMGEVLKVLLPALSGDKDLPSRNKILTNTVTLQLLIVVPVFVLVAVLSPQLLRLWIGGISNNIDTIMRIMVVSTALSCICLQFYWTLQAAGFARIVYRATVINMLVLVSIGIPILYVVKSMVLFALVFGLANFCSNLYLVKLAHTELACIVEIYNGRKWRLVMFGMLTNILLIVLAYSLCIEYGLNDQVTVLVTSSILVISLFTLALFELKSNLIMVKYS